MSGGRDGWIKGSGWFAILVLLSFFALGLREAIKPVPPWAEDAAARSTDPHDTLGALLDKGRLDSPLNPDFSSVKPGFQTDIATFRTKRGVVEILLREITLTHEPPDIDAIDFSKRTVIFNSTDEHQTVETGGIAGLIGPGCGLAHQNRELIAAGEAKFYACRGVYQNGSRIDAVINISIVNWAVDRRDHSPCYASDDPQACVVPYIKAGLADGLRLSEGYDVALVPALGTGVGKVSKQSFYKAFFEAFDEALSNGQARLPKKIFLLVWSGDDQSYRSVMDGIETSVADSERIWNAAHTPPNRNLLLRAAGAAGGFSALVLLIVVVPRSARLFPFVHRVFKFSQLGYVLLAPLICVMALEIIDKLSPMFSSLPPLSQMVVGFAIPALAGPVAAGMKAVKGALEQRP